MKQLYITTIEGYAPYSEEGRDAHAKHKLGDVVEGKFPKMRNSKFFRKWWALVKFAYDHWEPPELTGTQYEGVTPEKSFDRFRRDLVILAGYFTQEIRLDGSLVLKAKSLKWSEMTEETFAELYENTIRVILKQILNNYTRDDLDEVMTHVARF